MTQPNPVNRPVLLIAGILLIGTTIRAPVTSIAPVLGLIREHFSLGTAEAGALTTLPLLAFAIASPFAVLLAREYGLERSLFGALFLTAAGIALRSLDFVWCVFLGTAVIGVGIAISNVLLPSLLKRDFPGKIAGLTGAYALAAGVAAAIASTSAVPIAGVRRMELGARIARAVPPCGSGDLDAATDGTYRAGQRNRHPATWWPHVALAAGVAGHILLWA